MRQSDKPLEAFDADFSDPNAVFISGTEIENFKAGEAININADNKAFPAVRSQRLRRAIIRSTLCSIAIIPTHTTDAGTG